MPDPSPNAPLLTAEHLSVHYGHRSALEDVSFTVEAGHVIGVLGPNGAGKSTLLKVLAGMIPASHGAASMHGKPISGTNPCITYVPQRAGADWTFPISVIEAVLLGLGPSTPRWRGFDARDRERALAALRNVHMDTFADVQIGALSGGQQQRVFLARALLACGEVLLLDEPFTGVDIPTQELFTALFGELTSRGTSILYATHDLAQAQQSSDRILLVNRRLIADGPPDEVFRSEAIREAFGGAVIVLPERELATGSTAQ